MARDTPLIKDRMLSYCTSSGQQEEIEVESEAWWAWLRDAGNRTFHFLHTEGSFTARRERKSNGQYWYAYRKQQKRLYKAYLGKPDEITMPRLERAALHLAQPGVPSPGGTKTHGGDERRGKEREQMEIAAASTVQIPTNPLLTTKLFPPPIRADLVARPQLLRRLDVGLRRKLTVVSAPAGFGKSTLLSSWCSTKGRYAWLSLDKGDNDPTRFWSYIVAAIQRAISSFDEQFQSLLQALPLASLETFLTLLINTLAEAQPDLLLILDDYHVITHEAIHTALAFLLDHLPAGVHLVIASRNEPALPLIRLRALGQVNELHAAELRFTVTEVTAFLREVMGLELSAQEITALDEHTEGWVAGLQLAALSMQGQSNTAAFIASFTGNHRYILEYLSTEVLSRQPEHVQSFLLQTSILERLSAPLCNVVTERSDGAAMLEYLEHANLFLIPLDSQGQWYRYHHLFGEFLRMQLRQVHPELLSRLHQRACKWYEAYGLISATVDHALAAGDMEQTARLLERFAQTMLMRGEVTTFLHWLSLLPEEQIHGHFRLQLFRIGALITVGQLDEADTYIGAMEEMLRRMRQENPDARELKEMEGEFFGSRSVLAAFRGDLAHTIEYAQKALALISEENVFIRSVVTAGLGTAYLLTGDFKEAQSVYREAITLGEAAQNRHAALASMASQGYLQAMQGHLRQAALIYDETIRLGTRQGGRLFSVISMAYVLYGHLYYEWNDLDKAERYAREGIELGSHWSYVGMLAEGYTTLAAVQYARGNFAEAHRQIEQAEQVVRNYTHPYATVMVRAYRAWLQLRTGQCEAAIQWAEEMTQRQLPSNYNYEPVTVTLAHVALAQGKGEEVAKMVAEMLPGAREAGHMNTVLDCLILQALLLQQQGQEKQALSALGEALVLAETEGYIRIFIDKGEPIVHLLQKLALRHEAEVPYTYIRRLLEACGCALPTPSSRDTCVLSERERDVLRCVAAGKSNQDIADEFTIALSTVKTHINNIYSKLGVHSRTRAVARARELALLS